MSLPQTRAAGAQALTTLVGSVGSSIPSSCHRLIIKNNDSAKPAPPRRVKGSVQQGLRSLCIYERWETVLESGFKQWVGLWLLQRHLVQNQLCVCVCSYMRARVCVRVCARVFLRVFTPPNAWLLAHFYKTVESFNKSAEKFKI